MSESTDNQPQDAPNADSGPVNRAVSGSHLTVLSLGAGVQSTVLYLWSLGREPRLKLDAAVFADTGDEPRPVYEHLTWLESLGGPRIIRASMGVRLSDCLRSGMNGSGNRYVSIPAHLTESVNGLFGQTSVRRGMGRRQCTREFKLRVIEQTIRRDLFGLLPGRQLRAGESVTQIIGFSLDEEVRAARRTFAERPRGWGVRFPLIEAEMDRADCEAYLRDHVPHPVMRSACTFCPYRSDAEWTELRRRDPDGWRSAIEVDEALRSSEIAKRGMNAEMFVHKSRVPLRIVQLNQAEPEPQDFLRECMGECGV